MPQIKVKVFAVLLDSARENHLVWRGDDETKQRPVADAGHELPLHPQGVADLIR